LVELRAGRLDIAFLRVVGSGSTKESSDLLGLESLVVALEPYVLALPTGHPLAALRQVPLSLAGRYPLILFPRVSLPQLHDAVLGAFRASGVEPVVGQEVQGKHASLALVAAGLGLCLVPASARDWRRRGVELRPIEPTPGAALPVVEMRAAWRAGHAPASALALAGLAAL